MGFIFWPQENFPDDALTVYDKSGAKYSHVFMAKHLFLIPYAIFFKNAVPSVSN